jgi:hypothetical protein
MLCVYDRIDVGHEVTSILEATSSSQEATSSSQAVPDLLPVAILVGAVLFILLISFPLLIIWYCYKNRRIIQTERAHELVPTVRAHELVPTVRAHELVPTVMANSSAGEIIALTHHDDATLTTIEMTLPVVHNTVKDTASQSTLSTKQSSTQEIVSNPHESHDENSHKETLYSTLDHTKPLNASNPEEDYNTLQHAKNSRLAHSISDTYVPLYDTIDKPRTAQATLPPGGQPVYCSLENSRQSVASRKSKSTSTVEVIRTGKTEPDHTPCLGEPITNSTAENLGPRGITGGSGSAPPG